MAHFIITLSFISFLVYLYKFYRSGDILLILPIFYTFVVLYVIFGACVLTYAIEAPFGLYDFLSEDELYKGALSFIVSSFFFYLGASLVKKKEKYIFVSNNIRYQKTLVFCVLSTYFFYSVGYGVEALIHRSGYIDTDIERNKAILIIFFVVSPFITTLIPFIRSRAIRYLVFLVCFLVLFSSSSRFTVMVPFLYVIGTFLRFNKIRISVALVCLTLIIFGLVFVLQIRNYTFHGLIPNLDALFTIGVDIEYLFTGLNYAFSFSLFGVSYVLSEFTHDGVAFLTSINPLPSRFLDIEYMLEAQRMIGTSPMSAISTLSMAGYPILISFYFLSGYCFSFVLNKMKNVTFWYYAVVGLFVLFCLFSIQYNLRGLSRFLYYSMTIYLFHLAFKKITKKTRRRHESVAGR